jgi:uncharacterized protein
VSTLADRVRAVLKPSGQPDQTGPTRPYLPDAASGAGTRQDHLSSLEQVLGGEWRQDGGSCFVVETRWDPASSHGSETIATMASRLEEAADEALLLIGSPARRPFIFFDLETTGLGGGAGTYAFLVGFGWFDACGGFVTRQYLLVQFSDERPLLTTVTGELGRAGALVTFNGKSFDAPLLETRYLYHRLEWTGASLPHLDMLHASRRFWRRDGEQLRRDGTDESVCSLTALERHILGVPRRSDVPSFEIPSRYFHFVRTGDARPLKGVVEHNRLDLLSLAALTTRMLHLVRGGPPCARDAREALALGRTYARAGLERRAQDAYGRTIELCAPGAIGAGSSTVHVEALRALALASRRARNYNQAAGYWQRLLEVPGCRPHAAREASEALAIHHEHRIRDLETAKAFALRSLEHDRHPAWDEAARHRLARLERKLDSLRSLGPRLEFAEP